VQELRDCPLTRVCAGLFDCVEVEGVSYLAQDTSLLCSGDEYSQYSILGAVGILLYPVGIPCVFLFLVLRFRHVRHQPTVQPWLGFVTEAYRRNFAVFELVDMATKLIL
jgi:hypothetical protein